MNPLIANITKERASELLADAAEDIKSGTIAEWRAVAIQLAQRETLLIAEVGILQMRLMRYAVDLHIYSTESQETVRRIMGHKKKKGFRA